MKYSFKNMKLFVCLVALIALTMGMSCQVYASPHFFDVVEFSEKERHDFLEKIDLAVVFTEPKTGVGHYYDVNEEGQAAICFGNEDTIGVYDEEGTFLYGVQFDCTGAFSVLWDRNNLNILFIRSSVIATLDPSGNCVSCIRVADTSENDRLVRNSFFVTERVRDEIEYRAKWAFPFIDGFARLEATHPDGAVTIIYDTPIEARIPAAIGMILFLSFAAGVIYKMIYTIVSNRRNGKTYNV